MRIFPASPLARPLPFTSLLALPLIAALGCSSVENPDGRENVSGTITINDQPLTGIAGIKFEPIDKQGDGGGQGQIRTGKYMLTGFDGVKPGKYLVRITASVDFDKTTGKIADNTLQFGNEVPVDVVPPEFNRDSKIEFEVVAGKDNVFNYDIVTDYVPKMPENPKGKAAIPL